MMKKTPLVLMTAIAAMALTGCQQAPSVVGSWKLDQPISQRGFSMSEATTTYNSDNTFESKTTMQAMGQNIKVDLKGTYTIAEKTMNTTVTELMVNGTKADLSNPMIAQSLGNLNSSMVIEFAGNDKMKSTSDGITANWTRTK